MLNRHSLPVCCAWLFATGMLIPCSAADAGDRPNIVFCMADDWSWPHAGVLGDPVVKTPNFDRVANEGVLFPNAFVSTPSCTPSRLSVLTGQHHWRLKEGDSLGGSLREDYDVYTEMLQKSGYHLGRFGKGVWPSEHTFRKRDSFGQRYRSFDQFMKDRKADEPFCYWHGGSDPHRPYELGIGKKSGIDLTKIPIPACLPDNEVVRGDVADYLWEVQRFDREVGEILQKLEAIGELQNTIVVVSGDNGMPFPRCKATLYDQGTRVPLAVRWGAKVKGERTVTDFVSLCDLAPTFLQAAGLDVSTQMTGRSLLSILQSDQSGTVDATRTFALAGTEKHVYAYPRRSLRTSDFLYIRNFDPSAWATGQHGAGTEQYDFAKNPWPTGKGAFSYAIDPSPTKQLLRLQRHQSQVQPFADLAFGQRPDEELYDLADDPDQLRNVAAKPEYASALTRLRQQLTAELIKSNDPRVSVAGYSSRDVEGWPVRVSDRLISEKGDETDRALQLLASQLQTVKQVVPPSALGRIINVPIWLSPPYEGVRPTGEYHPGSAWLKRQGRPSALHQCVEFTNTAIFDREIKRMPVMVLHELAHAYHDQVLGNDNKEIAEVFASAKESGIYNMVQRENGKTERAYAITNPMEYFAELTEALFGRNDFYPFDRAQLQRHDPAAYDVLVRLWKTESVDSADETAHYRVEKPPADLRLKPFYEKYVDASGYPIIASSKVNDFALLEAAYLVDMMLAKRPDIRAAMVASGSRLIVMAHDEFTTDIPEHSHLRPSDYWDARARGLGGSRDEPVCSCGEENLLGFDGDPYSTENILIHEFAHNIHLRGLVNLDPAFDDRLKLAYEQAMKRGLWKGKYASTNHAEYFAEGVQSWFNNNRQPDHDHNHVDTRSELQEYDPGLAAICKEVFGPTQLVYTKPATRISGHLEGYDPEQSPRFQWPARLKQAKSKIRNDTTKRGTNRQKEYKN
ncbi:sulfatase-like hydrolase/transferase [Rubripirellula lacrimiformis]|nr:sulfatase-like hydrolase/transferase [Rubripirellula lacrimiformis]